MGILLLLSSLICPPLRRGDRHQVSDLGDHRVSRHRLAGVLQCLHIGIYAVMP
jgi:hypothetical protein